jgi:hypothetical protein
VRVRQIAGAATFTVGLVLLIPALAMGRVYVGDSNAGGDAAPCPNGHCGAIFAVPSAGGDGVVLAAGTSGGVLQHPSGLVPASDKALFAGDYGSDSIVRVNRETGAVNTFVSGPKLADLVELGRTHDALYYTTVSGNLFRVDLDDKSVRKVNSELLVSPQGVAVSGGHAYVSNSHSDIYKVNLSTGHVGYLVKESPKWNYGGELKLSPNHELLYLPASSPGILKIRISDGHVHKIADVAGTPLSIARRGGGGFLVGNNYFGDVEQVAKNGTVAAFSETPLFQYPTAGLVIGP